MAKAKPQQTDIEVELGSILRFKKYAPGAESETTQLQAGDYLEVVDFDDEEATEEHLKMFAEGAGPIAVLVLGRSSEDGSDIVEEVFISETTGELYDLGTIQAEAAAKAEKEAAKKAAPKSKAVKSPAKKELAVVEEAPATAEIALVALETGRIMDFVNSTDLHGTALRLARVRSRSSVALAGVLTRLYEDGTYRDVDTDRYAYGQGSFQLYIEDHFSGTVEYRTAMDMIAAYTFLSKHGIDIEVMDEIGYAKINKIRLLGEKKPEMVAEYIEKAKNTSRNDLTQQITEELGEVIEEINESDRTVKRKTYSFALMEADYEFIDEHIRNVMEEQGMEKSGEAIRYIVEQYATLIANVEVPVDRAVLNLEARYGIRLKNDKGEYFSAAKQEEVHEEE